MNVAKLLLVLLLLSTVIFSQEIEFIAKKDRFKGKEVAVVYYSKITIMRLISKGKYKNKSLRAKAIASKLKKYIKTPADVRKIKFTYSKNKYVARIKGNKLFSIYNEELRLHKSTVGGLMADWFSNLEEAFAHKTYNDSLIKEVEAVAPKTLGEAIIPTVHYVTIEELNKEMIRVDDTISREIKNANTKIISMEKKIDQFTSTMTVVSSLFFIVNTLFLGAL